MVASDRWQPLAVVWAGRSASTLFDLRPGQSASSAVAAISCGRSGKSAFSPGQWGSSRLPQPLWRGIGRQTTLPARFPSPPTTGLGPWIPALFSPHCCPHTPQDNSRRVASAYPRGVAWPSPRDSCWLSASPRSPPNCRRSGSSSLPIRPCRPRTPSARLAMPHWSRRRQGCGRLSCRSTPSWDAARAGLPGGPTSTGRPSRRRLPPAWQPTLPR